MCNFAAKIRIFFNVLIMERNFLEEEIPYEKMEKLGIGRTQLLKMPRDVLEPLMNGRITPLIMTRYQAENGKVISMPITLLRSMPRLSTRARQINLSEPETT